MNLNKIQIEDFNKNGFLILKNFASENLCEEILDKAKYHLKNKIKPYESEEEYCKNNDTKITIRRLKQVYKREEIFKEWMINKEIYPILKSLLKENPVLLLTHHNSIMTKDNTNSSRTFWHQDRRYWNYSDDNLISVWLSLDDEYLENGLLEFIPNSHKMDFKKESFDEDSNFKDDYNSNLLKKAIHQNLQKGDVVLFHCKTLHHASKNFSNNTKISFVYTVKGEKTKAIQYSRSDDKEIILFK